MDQIFRNAEQVIGWLGYADRFTDLAFDTVEEICWAVKDRVWRYLRRTFAMPFHLITHDRVDRLHEDFPKHFRATTKLMNSPFQALFVSESQQMLQLLFELDYTVPLLREDLDILLKTRWKTGGSLAKALISRDEAYFQTLAHRDRLLALQDTWGHRSFWLRRWIAVELVVAPKMIYLCGTRTLSAGLIWPVRCALLTSERKDDPGSTLLGMRRQFLQPLESTMNIALEAAQDPMELVKPSLGFNLVRSSWTSCSDLRDYVYASSRISAPLQINTDYSLTARDVFVKATRVIIALQ